MAGTRAQPARTRMRWPGGPKSGCGPEGRSHWLDGPSGRPGRAMRVLCWGPSRPIRWVTTPYGGFGAFAIPRRTSMGIMKPTRMGPSCTRGQGESIKNSPAAAGRYSVRTPSPPLGTWVQRSGARTSVSAGGSGLAREERSHDAGPSLPGARPCRIGYSLQ